VLPCNDVHGQLLQPYLQLRAERDRLSFINDLVMDGFTCQQIIKAVYSWALNDINLTQVKKVRIVKLVSDIEKNVFEGGRDDLNLILFFDKLKQILTARV
jgi:hypothetical protein